ncbi:hypothetical protein JKP88DRAFT_282506 [Tribonema minus]|uniref:Uncharacterized protein n=1 Tax=Tribonema minus TaxID=303371 RepID=A0A835YL98_9STRA|nr:hypothetical protein JKP88DRAFT_282506 [Tribonema minus]
MSANKNATAAAALIAHMTSDPTLEPADRNAVNAAIFHWASEQSVITEARRTLPEGSAWARHCYAPALTTMVNDVSAARVDCASESPSRLEYCTGEIIRWATEQAERADHPDAEKVALALGALGGRRAKEVLYGSEHPMCKVGEHRVAAVLCVKGRKRVASEEEFDTIIPADLYLHAVAFVRSRIPCETVADVNRAEARVLNRMESTPLLRKFKSAFLDHFKVEHRQRAGIILMRTLYATEMTKGSQRSLVDTARVLCHRPVRHAARHNDLIRAVEADTSEPAAAELEPVCSSCATLATAQDNTVADTLSDAVQDEHVPTRAVKRQKTAPAMRIEDAVTVVILCAAMAALKNNGHTKAQLPPLEAGAPSKRPRHKASLPHLCNDLVRRIRREGRQISEHLNAEYHRKRYADMSPHIQGLRTAQSQLGMLLHWIRWERTWSAAGSKASLYQGCTIRQALEGLRSDDRQCELKDER